MSLVHHCPSWAEELRRRYLRGEASQFILHGNVHDQILHEGELYGLSDYLTKVFLEKSRDVIMPLQPFDRGALREAGRRRSPTWSSSCWSGTATRRCLSSSSCLIVDEPRRGGARVRRR